MFDIDTEEIVNYIEQITALRLIGQGLKLGSLPVVPQYIPDITKYGIKPANRVVYEAHDYTWHHFPTSMKDTVKFQSEVKKRWLHALETAPVFLGETGAGDSTDGYWILITNLINNCPDLHFSIWTIDGSNGYSRAGFDYGELEPFGLLDKDWMDYRDNRLDMIECLNQQNENEL